jgi:hypothetical protein
MFVVTVHEVAVIDTDSKYRAREVVPQVAFDGTLPASPILNGVRYSPVQPPPLGQYETGPVEQNSPACAASHITKIETIAKATTTMSNARSFFAGREGVSGTHPYTRAPHIKPIVRGKGGGQEFLLGHRGVRAIPWAYLLSGSLALSSP